MGMIDFEYRILSKALEGEGPSFCILKKQLRYLKAIRRKRDYHRYSVEFEPHMCKIELVEGRNASIEIGDTCIRIKESEEVFYVTVTVIDGYVRWLNIGGKYDFNKPFTVCDVFWCKFNVDPDKHDEEIHIVTERDLEHAVGYIPVYR